MILVRQSEGLASTNLQKNPSLKIQREVPEILGDLREEQRNSFAELAPLRWV